jgi:hypothetical protein
MNTQTTLPKKVYRALVTGHFSTVGDIEVLHQIETRLQSAEMPFATTPFNQNRVALDPLWVKATTLDPDEFSHLIVVCGPYSPDYPSRYPEVFGRFRHCVHVGVNLTMIAPLAQCNPFDALLERDSDRMVRPDLSFLEKVSHVPVVGLCLVDQQHEYGGLQRHAEAARRLQVVLGRAGVATIPLDTVLPRSRNVAGIGTAAEFEAICSRLDIMVTTRLHGTVLSLKNGVPVLAVDAVSGGDKVTRQTKMLGWPESVILDTTSDEELLAAVMRCLQPEARKLAANCAVRARALLSDYDNAFIGALAALPDPARRPLMASRRGRLSRIMAHYRKWKRRWIPSRNAMSSE